MKNYEKYAEKMRKYASNSCLYCEEIIEPNVLKPLDLKCGDLPCVRCSALTALWLMEECEKPEVDWSTVAVDTPILVRDYEDEKWVKKHFAKFENGKVYTWFNGGTSWSSSSTMDWRYAELAETEDAE